jgi:hypothetical protein
MGSQSSSPVAGTRQCIKCEIERAKEMRKERKSESSCVRLACLSLSDNVRQCLSAPLTLREKSTKTQRTSIPKRKGESREGNHEPQNEGEDDRNKVA